MDCISVPRCCYAFSGSEDNIGARFVRSMSLTFCFCEVAMFRRITAERFLVSDFENQTLEVLALPYVLALLLVHLFLQKDTPSKCFYLEGEEFWAASICCPEIRCWVLLTQQTGDLTVSIPAASKDAAG